MKVTVKSLGVLNKETELEVKPLTVLIGPNNSGKTWLAYMLAGILGDYGRFRYTSAYEDDELQEKYSVIDDAVKQVQEKGNATIDLYAFAQSYGAAYFNKVAALASDWMDEYLMTEYVDFSNLKVHLQLSESETAHLLKHIREYRYEKRIGKGLLILRKKSGDNTLFIYTTATTENEDQASENLPSETIKEEIIRGVMLALHRSLYSQSRVFPTERTTLVTIPFSGTRQTPSPPLDLLPT